MALETRQHVNKLTEELLGLHDFRARTGNKRGASIQEMGQKSCRSHRHGTKYFTFCNASRCSNTVGDNQQSLLREDVIVDCRRCAFQHLVPFADIAPNAHL
jgi:hypothetical protein